ncbi:MAG: hypothetical protein Q8M03_12200, partial [Legionella sp.]|nr:hypothetical protein [Legionella sp.]
MMIPQFQPQQQHQPQQQQVELQQDEAQAQQDLNQEPQQQQQQQVIQQQQQQLAVDNAVAGQQQPPAIVLQNQVNAAPALPVGLHPRNLNLETQNAILSSGLMVFKLQTYIPTVEDLDLETAFTLFKQDPGAIFRGVSDATLRSFFIAAWASHMAMQASIRRLQQVPVALPVNTPLLTQTVTIGPAQDDALYCLKLEEDVKVAFAEAALAIGYGPQAARCVFVPQLFECKPAAFYGDDRNVLTIIKNILDVTVVTEAEGLPSIVFDAVHIFFPYFIHSYCTSSCNGVTNDSTPVAKLIIDKIRSML